MKRFRMSRILAIATTILCLPISLTVSIWAETTNSLDTEFAIVCRDVVERQAVDASTSFPASVERLFCFTKIVNANPPTEVTHVWYHGDTERARVTLAVSSTSWRTYSSKIIQSHEIGDWYVDVLDAEGDLLVSVPFKITQ